MNRLLRLATLTVATAIALSAHITSAQAKPITSSSAAQSGIQPLVNTNGDSRIEAMLDELDLDYDLDSYGNYQVKLQSSETQRTQVVLIRSQTSMVGSSEVREIVSPAYATEGDLPGEVANQLLTNSANMGLGSWQMYQNGGISLVAFSAKVDANCTLETFQDALNEVVDEADSLEAMLIRDDFF